MRNQAVIEDLSCRAGQWFSHGVLKLLCSFGNKRGALYLCILRIRRLSDESLLRQLKVYTKMRVCGCSCGAGALRLPAGRGEAGGSLGQLHGQSEAARRSHQPLHRGGVRHIPIGNLNYPAEEPLLCAKNLVQEQNDSDGMSRVSGLLSQNQIHRFHSSENVQRLYGFDPKFQAKEKGASCARVRGCRVLLCWRTDYRYVCICKRRKFSPRPPPNKKTPSSLTAIAMLMFCCSSYR